MGGDRIDFFVSHAGADRAWAEWVAWQLTDAGYTVELAVWDWAAGRNLMIAISDALDRCHRVVALFSVPYFERSRYTTEEWSAASLHVLNTDVGRLVPVRVEAVPTAQIPAVLRPLVYRDLFGLGEVQARRALLEAVQPIRPADKPPFPGHGAPGANEGQLTSSGPRLPGSVPPVWSVPTRNAGFTGRDELLVEVRERLLAGNAAVVQALHGMGGVGKTQLAAEYAHRFAGSYDVVWWVAAEQAALIGDQFAALGAELGCVDQGASTDVVRAEVRRELRKRGGYLLVFDNADRPTDVAGWLPSGGGHVLITSRERNWTEIAAPIEVDVLARAESVTFLQGRVPGLKADGADKLAAGLGDLPLALAQAAAFMVKTGTPTAKYLDLLRTRAAELLGQSPPLSYLKSLAAATDLTADLLAASDPAAAELADLCAFFAPEPICEDLFTTAAKHLPPALAERAGDALAWPLTLARLAGQALARIDQHVDHSDVQMHRLTQAILRDRLDAGQSASARAQAEAILAASNPHDPGNPATWPRWAPLMPHLLAADLAATDNLDLRSMACEACAYLLARGETPAGHDLAVKLRQHWREQLGDDDQYTLTATYYLGWALFNMGSYAKARDLDQDTLDRRRSVLGDDHPDALASADSLAGALRSLGDYQAAIDLAQDTLKRKRRVLGDDHPNTLTSASNLAATQSDLGHHHDARDLDRDTLERKRRVLGDDHPDTLASASNLAATLTNLGDYQAARDLAQDTLERKRRVLGDDHPDTLASATCLAAALHALGDYQAARNLAQDTLERCRRVLGNNHPDTLASEKDLATYLRALDEPDDRRREARLRGKLPDQPSPRSASGRFRRQGR